MPIYERGDWLLGRIEEPIDAAREIVDPHHHLWDRADSVYLAPELVADTRGGHNVVQTVFVECSASYDDEAKPAFAPIGETRFVAEQARHAATLTGADGGRTEIAAIVGHADLRLGAAVTDVIDAHIDAGDGLFRGVRHGTNWSDAAGIKIGHHQPTDGLMADVDFRAGVAALGAAGLSFDAWLYFPQLHELAELARAVPGTTIVLNHLGGPLGIGAWREKRAEMNEMWRAGMADVASCPNVVLKVGGIGMEHYFGTEHFGTPWADLAAPPASDQVAEWWHDMVRYAIDTFGPDRAMFESNFPVDRQTLPYTILWNAFQILSAGYSSTELDDLFAGTARRAYRL